MSGTYANQDHWEARRKERVFQQKAHAQLQNRAAPSGGTGCETGQQSVQQLQARTGPHEASVPACDDGVWRSTYTGLDDQERQRRSARYQQEMDERYSAKVPNRYTSVNYAQQW